ncbi:MAG: ATP-binding protein [Pseudomonadota bacterium]
MADDLARYGSLRRELEQAVQPLATSVDGRRFSLRAPLGGATLQPGGYVLLDERIGQVTALRLGEAPGPEIDLEGGRARVTVRMLEGDGVLLDPDTAPFHDARVRPAGADDVAAHLERTAAPRARLEVGELALASHVPLELDAGGFDRHTFLCGQSGSGKTYSLGVILERLLAETSLRVVVLDPNSDFISLGMLREGGGSAPWEVAVRRADDGLHLRLLDLDPETQAAMLRLDPVADRDEYAELRAILETEGAQGILDLERSEIPERRRLWLRIRALGALEWQVWAGPQRTSVIEEVAARDARALVLDLGSLGTPEEQALVSAAVLGELWRRRAERKPVLIVIDEAHNVCPAAPGRPLTAVATETAIRIAAEGRKFGLHLLVSTQRPQKVHEQVLSQCDNLVLMRMNSAADLAHIAATFSFVPPGLLDRATAFRQGEALVAGKIAPHPALVRFGARMTAEGGSDVPADWAELRD